MANSSMVKAPGLATPPQEIQPIKAAEGHSILGNALQVLSTEARALLALEELYRTDEDAQAAFSSTVNLIASTVRNGGKVVVCGIGKSGHIGTKFVASMNSLSLTSVLLHAAEAMHGDLGMVRDNDMVLFISFSGNSPELVALLPHLPSTIPVVCLTGQGNYNLCPAGRSMLLPAPIHVSETEAFGVKAPTSSTTVALALCDALAISSAKFLHALGSPSPAEVFAGNHPGGAIGVANRKAKALEESFFAPKKHAGSVNTVELVA